jgi:ABC-type branched-subunit amino acid transport system permease subunit
VDVVEDRQHRAGEADECGAQAPAEGEDPVGPQLFGAVVSLAAFGGLHLLMSRTDFGRALEATREDPEPGVLDVAVIGREQVLGGALEQDREAEGGEDLHFGAVVSLAAFGGLHLLMSRTDFGRALEATREDQGAVQVFWTLR